jgi:outer membrane protein assembly factor BamB
MNSRSERDEFAFRLPKHGAGFLDSVHAGLPQRGGTARLTRRRGAIAMDQRAEEVLERDDKEPTMTRICQTCGNEVRRRGARFCGKCGSNLAGRWRRFVAFLAMPCVGALAAVAWVHFTNAAPNSGKSGATESGAAQSIRELPRSEASERQRPQDKELALGGHAAPAAEDPATSNPWPMVGHDARHTGQSPFSTAGDTGALKWSFSIGSGGEGQSPAVASDGTIYVASADRLYAINPEGRLKWKRHVSPPCSPAIGSDGTIYVCRRDELVALNREGKPKWTFPIGPRPKEVTSSPVLGPEGGIYFSGSKYLYALNPNGGLKWEFPTPTDWNFTPAIGSDGTAYFVGMFASKPGVYLYAISDSGALNWKLQVQTGPLSSVLPVIGSEGTIYLYCSMLHRDPWGHTHADQKGLNGFNPDGTLKRKLTWGFALFPPAIGSDGTIYFESGLFGPLEAITSAGIGKWSARPGAAFTIGPVIGSDGAVYFSDADGVLAAVDRQGKVEWIFPSEGKGPFGLEPHGLWHGLAIGSDGTIYAMGNDGKLYAIH